MIIPLNEDGYIAGVSLESVLQKAGRGEGSHESIESTRTGGFVGSMNYQVEVAVQNIPTDSIHRT